MRIIFLNGSQTGSTAWPFVDELDIMERYSGETQFTSKRAASKALWESERAWKKYGGRREILALVVPDCRSDFGGSCVTRA